MIAREIAETVAMQALTWMVSETEVLHIFLNETGATAQDLKEGAKEPEFLASVLDFLMLDDDIVVACCTALDLPNDSLLRARVSLPGGFVPDWT
jgi:hypothetical protein